MVVSEDLGCDIAWRPNSASDFFEITSGTQAKVNQLEGELTIDEDVLELKVAMHHACLLMHVFETVQHLVEEQAACIFTKAVTA